MVFYDFKGRSKENEYRILFSTFLHMLWMDFQVVLKNSLGILILAVFISLL